MANDAICLYFTRLIPFPIFLSVAEPEDETDEILGPVEPPFPSASYKQNFTVWTMRDIFTQPGDPFYLYPYTPFEKLLPTDAKFYGKFGRVEIHIWTGKSLDHYWNIWIVFMYLFWYNFAASKLNLLIMLKNLLFTQSLTSIQINGWNNTKMFVVFFSQSFSHRIFYPPKNVDYVKESFFFQKVIKRCWDFFSSGRPVN